MTEAAAAKSAAPTALVSGGSRGLGLSVVADLLDHGYQVATFSRSETEELKRLSCDRLLWVAADALDAPALKRAVAMTLERFGRIDALVNNAGVLEEGLLPLMKPEAIHRVIAVNLESVMLLTQSVTKAMLRQQGGAIVNVSSLNGVRGHTGVSVYSATKAGLDGFTRSLARELGPRAIRVNSVAPGFFESDMTRGMPERQRDQIVRRTPLGRLGASSDICGVIRFLLSKEAAFVTGQTVVVDGGLTC